MIFLLAVTALGGEPLKPRFDAGSYGRVQASTDLAGGGGDRVNVASHSPRLDLGPYLELDLGWSLEVDDGAVFRVLITPALSGDLFHFDGTWGDELSLRNLYASASGFSTVPIEVWAGSRMYRGDDIYLLDFWPLDSLNTYGGGVIVRPGNTEIAAHVGVNRLLGDDWQVQTVLVATPGGVGGEEVLVLDRQRMVASLRAAQHVPVGSLTLRAKVYGEVHALPAGDRVIDGSWTDWQIQSLPSDMGSLLGLQVSLWGWADQSFVHLWLRRSTGLAAVGELTIPKSGFDLDLRTRSAESWMAAVTGNTELGPVGIMAGAYLSYSEDADGIDVDFDDRWEVVGVVRPNVYAGRYVAIGAELSQQYVRPNGLNPRTDAFDVASVTKVSLLPGLQLGNGGYARPRIQMVYTASFLNQGARRFYAGEDARIDAGVQHFVGLGAEWWLNSNRVITPGG